MKGILFKPEMIQAILEGRKTQTRRIIKSKHESGLFQIARYKDSGNITEITPLDWNERPKNGCTGDIRPKYKVGEVIYVKEGWCPEFGLNKVFAYKADYKDPKAYEIFMEGVKWKNAMFMPASAARIFLEITNVRVEKLREITAEDILSEGVGDLFKSGARSMTSCSIDYRSWEIRQKTLWETLWTKINKSYDSKTWVFVYIFKKVERP